MTEIISHRGYHITKMENTVEAFSESVKLGVDWIELDVHRLQDNEWAVHHNKNTPFDKNPISSYTRKQLLDLCNSHNYKINFLEEVFEVTNNVKINIECKTNSYKAGEQLAEFITKHNRQNLDHVSSFYLNSLIGVKNYSKDIEIERLGYFLPLRKVKKEENRIKFYSVNPYYKFTTSSKIKKYHEQGLKVNVWTVNDPKTMLKLISKNVDGIITNRPDILMEILSKSKK